MIFILCIFITILFALATVLMVIIRSKEVTTKYTEETIEKNKKVLRKLAQE